MTNFKNIKNMSIEEMAKGIFDKVEEGCRYCLKKKCPPITGSQGCVDGIIDWLQSEVEE